MRVFWQDLGLIDYKEAWDYQTALFERAIQQKVARRDNEEIPLPEQCLLFCEHPHVYTLGKSGKAEHLLLDEPALSAHQAAFYPINRGGDITYHGPGQLVMYPIFDLDQIYTDIHRYLRDLEEAVIRTLAAFGIQAERFEGYTGVWLDTSQPDKARKICAMGVKTSRWVTMHGIGFNINTQLHYFDHIVPCGIADKQVTSLQQELGREISMQQVRDILLQEMVNIFGFTHVTLKYA